MRLGLVLLCLAACADSYGSLSLDPPAPAPLGVGLVETFQVWQDYCEGGIDGTCDPTNAQDLAVRVTSGDALAIAAVDPELGTFDVAGLAEGTATVEISAAGGAKLTQTIDVVSVAQTILTVPRDVAAPAVSPVRAFTGSFITIAQENLGAGGTTVSGKAPLQASSSLVAVGGDVVTTFAQPGTVQITAAAATLELDLVDASALADFTIDGSNEVVLYASTGTAKLELLAADAMGRPIVGGGPTPSFTIADPSLFAVTGGNDYGNAYELDVEPLAAGNTTLQLTWGQVTKTFAISIVAR